ncbi:WD40 repeat-like protein, partial [Rhizoctonia solani]
MLFRSKISGSKLAVPDWLGRSKPRSPSQRSELNEKSPASEQGSSCSPSSVSLTHAEQKAQSANALYADTITPNTAWAALNISLRRLRESSGLLPRLGSAIDDLLGFSDTMEKEGTNNEMKLISELKELCDSLAERLVKQGHWSASDCMYGLVTSEIERKAQETEAGEQHPELSQQIRLEQESSGEETEYYWRVIELLKQLEAGVRLRIMDNETHIVSKLKYNLKAKKRAHIQQIVASTLEETLCPARKAAYSSFMSIGIGRRACTKGTHTEVLASLDQWLYDPNAPRVYWMKGMQGVGKTTIAYTLCKQLEHRGLLGASFFCTRTSAECRDTTRIIPTIAYQLSRYSMSFRLALHGILEAGAGAHPTSPETQWERLVQDPLEKVGDAVSDGAVVVIDGLDECDDDHSGNGSSILDVLLRCFTGLPLRLFISTQPTSYMWTNTAQEHAPCARLDLDALEPTCLKADILRFLEEELSCVPLSSAQLSQLVLQSSLHFKNAAYIARTVKSGYRRSDRYKHILSVVEMTSEVVTQNARISELFRTGLDCIQNAGWKHPNAEQFIRMLVCLNLFTREPISVDTVAGLYEISDVQRLYTVLRPLLSALRPVTGNELALASSESGPLPTLAHYLSMEQFSYTLYSQDLAERCFRTMEQQLRFNICDLPSSCILDRDVSDLQERIQRKISPALSYACRHWADHLAHSPHSGILRILLRGFLTKRLLFWLEVLSVRGELVVGTNALGKAKGWVVQSKQRTPDMAPLLDDSLKFVAGFASSGAAKSTPHIYISWLPWWPRSSLVYKNYWHRTQGLLGLKGGLINWHRNTAALNTWNTQSQVFSVACSLDGSRVAIGCKNGTVSIRNAYNQALLVSPFKAHTNCVRSVVFSPDGGLLASGSDDFTIRVWDVRTGTPVAGPCQGHTHWVWSISFSPDSKRIVSGSLDKTVCIWDTGGALLVGPLHGHTGSVLSVTYSPDGTLIASASADKTIRLWRSDDGAPVASPFRGHTGSVNSVVFTPDGNRLVSGSGDKTVRVWRVSDGSAVTTRFPSHTGGVNSVSVSPDGTLVASGSHDHTVRVWRTSNGSLVAGPIVGHTDIIWSVRYSSDGGRIISGSSDETVRIWAIYPPLQVSLPVSFTQYGSSNGQPIWNWHHSAIVTPIPLYQIAPSGTDFPLHAAYSPIDHSVQVISTLDQSHVAGPLHGHTDQLTAFAFSSASSHLATGSRDCSVRVWDLSRNTLDAGPFWGHGGEVTSVSLSPDCSRVASYSKQDQTIRVWNTRHTVLNIMLPFIPSPSPIIPTRCRPWRLKSWQIREDGWVTDDISGPLMWIPHDLTSWHIWPSPHLEYVATEDRVWHIPQQELLLGARWSGCYVSD